MANLYVPWGSNTRQQFGNRSQIRNQFASSLELHKQSSYDYQENIPQRQRSPSLPPICKNQGDYYSNQTQASHNKTSEQTGYRSYQNDVESNRIGLNRNILPQKKDYSCFEDELEGDTSGYATDSVHFRNNYNQAYFAVNLGDANEMSGNFQGMNQNGNVMWPQIPNIHQRSRNAGLQPAGPGSWSPLAVAPNEEPRPRWGDRGVATGRLWEPQEPTARLPQMQIHKKGTPAWVERGLSMAGTSQMLAVDQTSSEHSHCTGNDCDRSSCAGSEGGRTTFLRGQNVPLEPDEKAQREFKRLKALEIQSILLSQLEERERRKKAERDMRIKEEKEEELRLKKQQQDDLKRIEEERRQNEEKRQAEVKKLEALRKAMEEAENKAKREKENRKKIARSKLSESSNECVDQDNVSYCKTFIEKENSVSSSIDNQTNNIIPISLTKVVSPRKSIVNSPSDASCSQRIVENVFQPKDNLYENVSNINTPRSPHPRDVKIAFPSMNFVENQVGVLPITVHQEILSPVSIQQNGLQLAVLVPQNHSFYNIQQPISLQSVNSGILVQTSEFSSGERLLTPRKYRNPKSRDAFTQTDNLVNYKSTKSKDIDKPLHDISKDYQNIDDNAPRDPVNNSQKTDRHHKSEERYKKEIENRPKWGVNKPQAQYKKQSEKDPFYSQKRKVRHRLRQRPSLSQSSEESRSPSPPNQTDKIIDKGQKFRVSLSQAHWRSKFKSQDIVFKPSDENVETVQIKPLQCNNDGQVVVGEEINENEHRRRLTHNKNTYNKKRFTYTQKFINDKYGNRKLWHDESEYNDSSFDSGYSRESRKAYNDRINRFRKTQIVNDVNGRLLSTEFSLQQVQ